jgi:hypothetical protein
MVETRPGQKPLKKYEKINLLKKRVREAETEFEFYESRVPKMERNLEQLREYHKNIEMVSIKELENMKKVKADWYQEIENRKRALRTFDKPKAKPKPPEPKKNGNGKKLCDICNKEFANSGYPAHRKSCERLRDLRQQLEEELTAQEDLENKEEEEV